MDKHDDKILPCNTRDMEEGKTYEYKFKWNFCPWCGKKL